MAKKSRHPRWWQIGLFAILSGILGFLEARTRVSPTGHVVIQLLIVLFFYGLLFFWVSANTGAWLNESYEMMARLLTVGTECPLAEPNVVAGEKQPSASMDQPASPIHMPRDRCDSA